MSPQIIYINLASRPDRRSEIETELSRMGLSGERFDAIHRKPGIVGCGLSHLAVLKLAKERGYKEILIMEDDFVFTLSPERMREIFDILPSVPFDVCMLGYNLHHTHGDYLSAQKLPMHKVKYAQTASAYIVREHYYDTLIELYEWAIPELERTGMHWVYANDVVWRSLQENDLWVCPVERCGRQRPGYSDNAESYMDHGV